METNIKKLEKITIALAVLIIAISAAAALPTATNFGVEDATGNQSTFVEVPVNITNVQNESIAGIIFDITFDPSVLNLTRENVQTDAALGDLTADWDTPFFNPTNGRVSIVFNGNNNTLIQIGASGSVLILNFSVVGAPGTESPINISRIQLSNLPGDVGTATAMSGTFTVAGPTETVTVTPTATETLTATPTATETETVTPTATVPPETRRVIEIVDNMSGVPLINQSTMDILAEDFINFNSGDPYNITITRVTGGVVEYNATGTLTGGPKQTLKVNWTPQTIGAYILRSDAATVTETKVVQVINQKVISPIPELSTMILVSAGLLGLFGLARKRKNS